MDDPTIQKLQSRYIALGLKLAVALVFVIGLIWGGHKAFVRFQEGRFRNLARASFQKGDYRWAAIAARRMLELNPKSADACRIIAEICEKEGAIAAIEWRRQVVKLRPDSVEDALALAKTEMHFGQLAAAKASLAPFETKAAKNAAFHEEKAQIAVAEKDIKTAENEFAEAVRLDPAEQAYALDLAIVQLQSASSDERLAAKQKVQRFLDDPGLRKRAARALRDNAFQQMDVHGAVDNAKLLADLPGADFQDRLVYLQMLRQLGQDDYPVRLLDLENEASGDPAKATSLLEWLSATQQPALALDWANRQLPTAMTTRWPVAAAIADCHAVERDWPGLQDWCRKTEWGEMDFLRDAALARALREQGATVEFEREWNESMRLIGSDATKMHALQQTVAAWGWKAESLELLWGLTKDPAQQFAALDALFQYYLKEGDTANLYRVVLRTAELRPDDPKTENNIAQLELLLRVEHDRAMKLAKKAYEREPSNPSFASTFAFSLYTEGQFARAVDAFRTVKEADLRDPAIAAYYGIVLTAAGDKDKAREFLALAKTANLLPEERELVNRAEAANSKG